MDSDKVFKPQTSSLPVTESSQSPAHLLIKCTGTSNPPPVGFAWFRRNGTELIRIQPSPETDHKLLVALEDEFGYVQDNRKNRLNDGFLSDQQHGNPQQHQQSSNGHFGHWRESAVLRVPSFAQLEEYACVVKNHIGESQPCWFDSANDPAGSSSTDSSWVPFGTNPNDVNNTLMVALTAIGLTVFVVLVIIGTVLFVCWHRNRQPSFKGFGGSSSLSSKATPQRFKLDSQRNHLHGHHLADTLPGHLLEGDVDLGFLDARTATLTAGYRMTGANGTLANNFRTMQHLSREPLTKSTNNHGTNITQPILPTSGSIYGENSSQNSSQNGSRPFLVSYASSNVYAEPDYIANGSSNHSGDQMTGSTNLTSASSRLRQAEDNYPTYEELDTARSAIRQLKQQRRRKPKLQNGGEDDSESEAEEGQSVPLAPYLTSGTMNPPTVGEQDSAYNPERDFYLPPVANQFEPTYGGRNKRALPTKYGSLLRQSTVPASPLRATLQQQPAQFQASPMSTRIYFNFNDDPSAPQPGMGPDVAGYGMAGYNSLARYGPANLRTRTTGRPEAQQQQQAQQQHSFDATPPDYHRIFQN